jgi:hypothetical protein
MIPACVEANTLSQKYYLSFCTSCHQEKFLKSQLLTIKNWHDVKALEQLPKNHIMKQLRMGYTDEQWQMIINALQ